ncbi:MAG: hypothetical protein DRJ63_10135 [Thermoprotei archaeon]|nr:MAG: hypothetical protein DRJ63_10135 [Thermoprotei archaeon]
MKTKDSSVETKFHPLLTSLLFSFDAMYRKWGGEITITSGSEHTTRHGKTSLHYATPACAVDTRIWDVIVSKGSLAGTIIHAQEQYEALLVMRDLFCKREGIPSSWIDVILEKDHIHTEYQPKREGS